MTSATLLAIIVLAAPTADLSAELECERLVAAGAWAAAGPACAAHPETAAALQRAAAAMAPPHKGRRWKKRATAALALVEAARTSAPDGVIEEAFAQHAARLLRATLRLRATPPSARLPLPGLQMPGPTLPPLDYAPLQQSSARIASTRARIRETRVKVQQGGPESLRKALAAMERELKLLLDSHLATLEDAIQRDRDLPPTYWLHLAEAYFAVDGQRADSTARRARGSSVLAKLRERFPDDGAAGIAALWQAGFALADGDRKRVRVLLDEAGPFDPDLSAYLESLLHWHAGRDSKARAAVSRIGKSVSALLRVHADALMAELALDPAQAAARWAEVGRSAPDAPLRRRAELRRAASWAETVVAGAPAGRVPASLQRHAVRYLLSRGQLVAATAVFRALTDEQTTAADLPARALQLVDAVRATGDDATADRLLVWAGRRFGGEGVWRRAHPAEAKAFATTVGRRIDARLAPFVSAGIALDEALRRSLSGLVDVRAADVSAPWSERLALVRRLGTLGYGSRANVILKRMRREAEGEQRIEAARTMVDIAVARACVAGVAGASTGRFLHGPPAKRPMPVEVRGVIDAQTALIGALRPETDERDTLLVDRATIRIEFGDASAVLEDLRDVAGRRVRSELGLRAIYRLVAAQPQRRAEYDALKFARRQAGHAAREDALLTTFKGVYSARKGDEATNLFRQRLFINAARIYDGVNEPWAKVAAAVSYTLALHARTAAEAWGRFIDQHPDSPLVADARRHLADLLVHDGRPRAAAAQLEALAASEGEAGAAALRRAIELRRYDRDALTLDLKSFLEAYPDHTDAPALRRRLTALGGVSEGAVRPVGPPPAPIAPCRATRCATTPFWPAAQPRAAR